MVDARAERLLQQEIERLQVALSELNQKYDQLVTRYRLTVDRISVLRQQAARNEQAWNQMERELNALLDSSLTQPASSPDSSTPRQTIFRSAPFINSTELDVAPTRVRTKQEYVDLRRTLGNRGSLFEAALIEYAREVRRIDLVGYCEACEQIRQFSAPWSPEETAPNFRESLRCQRCGLWSRLRKVAGYVKATHRADQRDIYLYEQVTSFYSWMRTTFADANVIGSEYLDDNIPGGTIINGVRHEDATSLSFADASFDLIVSCEVFEHVPDIRSTLSEAVRVLRPGGQLIMTIPFHSMEETTVQRATLEHGKLTHHLPPQYHGNPVSPDGSLVYFDYGWDFLSMCRDAGFKDTYMVPYYSLWQAHIGEGPQGYFVAEK